MISDKAVFGLPLPISHGLRPDGSTYITCGAPADHGRSFSFSGSAPEALALSRALDALPLIVAALKATRAECRDPDSDAFLSAATGDLIDQSLQSLGVRP